MATTKPDYVWIYKFKIFNRTHRTRVYATEQLALDKVADEIGCLELDRVVVDNEDGSKVYMFRDGIKMVVERMEVRNSIIEES